ncbi:hypothetical protein [Streptomyces eurythermus]
MTLDQQLMDTRVCIDDTLGPLDCKIDREHQWNGRLSPLFTLDAVRELSAQTLREGNKYSYGVDDTVHVIDGRANSPDTVHVIELPVRRDTDEPLAVAVRINWRQLDQDPAHAVSVTEVTTQARKDACRRQTGGGRAPRAVVVHVRWQYLSTEGPTAVEVVQRTADGLYSVGGWEWNWYFSCWDCPCGQEHYWHQTVCPCGFTRDDLPTKPIEAATWRAGSLLRRLVPEATAALVDLTHLATVCVVFAGDTEVDMAEDTGPFDCETLGAADRTLREVTEQAAPGDLAQAGWEQVPDADSDHGYRLTFPTARQ